MHTLHPTPASKKAKPTPIDRTMSIVAFLGPMLGVPQVVQVYAGQNASGLSLFSWVAFALVALVFLLYALKHRIKPLIITEGLWLAIYLAVIPGILIYG